MEALRHDRIDRRIAGRDIRVTLGLCLSGWSFLATPAMADCLRVACDTGPCGVEVRFADGAREVFKAAAHGSFCLCDLRERDRYCALKDDGRPDRACEPAPMPPGMACGNARRVSRHVGVKWDQAF